MTAKKSPKTKPKLNAKGEPITEPTGRGDPPSKKTKKNGDYHPSTTGKPNPKADQSNWRTRLQASRIKFDDEQKDIYLAELADHGRKGEAAQKAGVSGQTVANHIENDPDFEEAVGQAIQAYRDKFVKHAINDLAFEGIEVKKYNKDGELVEERRDYPVKLIEMELKRVDPEYRDKSSLDLTSGGGVMVAPPAMTPNEWIDQQNEANAEKDKAKKDG